MVFPQVKLSSHFKQKGIGRLWGGPWDSGQETQSGFSQGWSIRIQGSFSVLVWDHRSLFSTENDQLILVWQKLSAFSTDSAVSWECPQSHENHVSWSLYHYFSSHVTFSLIFSFLTEFLLLCAGGIKLLSCMSSRSSQLLYLHNECVSLILIPDFQKGNIGCFVLACYPPHL